MRLKLIPSLHRATHRVALGLSASEGMPTQGEAHLLAHLLESGPCTVGALHRALGHKRSTLTAILDRMEASGWVERRVHVEDRRTFLVSLASAGREAALRASALLMGLEAKWEARVPPEDWAAALRVLKAMAEDP